MSNQTISIFENKIFFEILKEMVLFSKYEIIFHKDFDLCTDDATKKNQLVVFFVNDNNFNFFNNIKKYNFPIIFAGTPLILKKISFNSQNNQLNIPFRIIDFKKKVITSIASNEFKKNSLINLGNYIIDKNERKIKKDNLELQLSEKEINFLVLFIDNDEPINKNFVLKNVWNYSIESETHTVETHIHRLRKKILQKFGDSNFIKNNNKGYYI
jgi:hypothetical protein